MNVGNYSIHILRNNNSAEIRDFIFPLSLSVSKTPVIYVPVDGDGNTSSGIFFTDTIYNYVRPDVNIIKIKNTQFSVTLVIRIDSFSNKEQDEKN